MDASFYISGLVLGMMSSFHCAGMCGPIVLMLPADDKNRTKVFMSRLIYNAGRILMYLLIGILSGILGWSFALKGFQRELSVLSGVMILLSVLFFSGKTGRKKAMELSALYSARVRPGLKKLFADKSNISLFMIGLLNGLLPCGFVYLAIAGSAASGSFSGAILYMSFFGFGTLPVMMILSAAGIWMNHQIGTVFKKLTPAIAVLLALLLIYRGTDRKTNQCARPEMNMVSCY